MVKCSLCGQEIVREDILSHLDENRKPVYHKGYDTSTIGGKTYHRKCAEAYEKQLELSEFKKYLNKVDAERRYALETFDKRFRTLQPHGEILNDLKELFEKYKDYKREGPKRCRQIKKIIKKLRKAVVKKFANFLREEILEFHGERDRAVRIRAMRAKIQEEKINDFFELRQLQRERILTATGANKKIIEITELVNGKVAEGKQEIEFEEKFSEIFDQLRIVLMQQKEHLEKEVIILGKLDRIMDLGIHEGKYLVDETELLLTELNSSFNGLRGALIGEKNRVMDPLDELLEQKRRLVDLRRKEYGEKGRLTKHEILKDIKNMTNEDELVAYASFLRKFIRTLKQTKAVDEEKIKEMEDLYEELDEKLPDIVENLKKQKQELEKTAYKDGLTGAHNRRYLDEELLNIIRRLIRKQKSNERLGLKTKPEIFSFVIFDIDFFKKFNDTFGHPIGDRVLKRVAELTPKLVKKEDIFVRFGGEEFVLVLLGADINVALKRADEVREHLAKQTLSDVGRYIQENPSTTIPAEVDPKIDSFTDPDTGRVVKKEQMDYGRSVSERIGGIRVSMGISEFPRNCKEIPLELGNVEKIRGRIIELADKALYKAKKLGRFRVVKVDDLTEADLRVDTTKKEKVNK